MKKVIWTGLLAIAVLLVGAFFLIKEITHAQMPDLETAARLALDHSALNQVEGYEQYTGGPTCYVFLGKDKLGRSMMVFSTKERVLGSEYLDKGVTGSAAEDKARKEAGLTEIIKTTPGLVDSLMKNPSAGKASGRFLWEVYGASPQGQKKYVYLDFYTGNVIATYVLKPTE
ncbi:DUF5590 domain-containing protein [Effusibacillus lacus]|uniref:DUF5590 domain-containing protein n=1 Tax=Effusibacillus lacus TaxID=1348429 RepID=A0A292YIN3_9BACL|nr:DUF5590 domain-containing protein [Effusibacillus lacus]TCS75344.1 uncharacterized protein YpmB [Effusibacillus lacus]GAX89778.1 hypothetical protein EFBL_1403 [Effusibacillus lacus]